MRSPIRVVGVVVPANDEEDEMQYTVASLTAAARRVDVPVIAVVVLDACTDGTGDVVRRHVEADDGVDWHCISTHWRRASSSRQSGLEHLVTSLDGRVAPRHVAVLSTDADTVVPSDWIAHHVGRLDEGDDAIAGIVDLAREGDDALSYDDWKTEYSTRFRADGSHPHVHCANLSVRLDVLLAAGGFGHLARAEDIDLWKRLRSSTGARIRADQRSVVRTSRRLDGRVSGGFATALRGLCRTDTGAPSAAPLATHHG